MEAGSPGQAAGTRGRSITRSIVLVLLVAGAVVAAYFVAASVLPRWWSHQVGRQVDGDLTTGGLLGFMYGVLATLLPLLVIGIVWRFARRSVWAWIVGIVVALALAAPNLVTLGITLGNGSAAHAADRTLDVEAPWFRGGMVIGVVVGLGIAVYVAYATASHARAHRRAASMHEQLPDERETDGPGTTDAIPGEGDPGIAAARSEGGGQAPGA